jgi:hypothetical protein
MIVGTLPLEKEAPVFSRYDFLWHPEPVSVWWGEMNLSFCQQLNLGCALFFVVFRISGKCEM